MKDIGEALARVHETIKKRDHIHVLHTSELSRNDREVLTKSGWLQEIIKGWYLLIRPDLRPGDSSGWYATFWEFLYVYLSYFYEEEYCLSAEHSLDLHLGVTVVPKQVIVLAPKGRGVPLELPFDTSLYIYAPKDSLPIEREKIKNLQVMSLSLALCKVSPSFFQTQPREAEIALQLIQSPDELLRILLQHNFVRAAGRLVGAYRFLGNKKMVDALAKGLSLVNFTLHESNPFIHPKPFISSSSHKSPYAARIYALWQQHRQEVLDHFPKPPGLPRNSKNYLHKVEEQYSLDAYHSLSIEGYKVSEDLIKRVLNAEWDPDKHKQDLTLADALAARGYYEAFLAVQASLEKVLLGASPGETLEEDLSEWYQKLFAPCVAAKIVKPAELFGYRRHQVYIRNSRHTPLPSNALLDAMEILFQCLKEEEHASVRAVLGHFLFVYIHPYMDGNGRIGRFLMNLMLGSGGYPWTIVHLENRESYLNAIEAASSEENIIPFVKFLRSEMEKV
ncbi:MAG: hypothetical protein K940chlam9_00668 [Chlamydiae bacterium]|nr:hypothetical protein [Chlamydiota bacterium]